MYIKCHYCGEVCETEFEPEIGQHVRCPFCGEKFAYSCDVPEEETARLAPLSSSEQTAAAKIIDGTTDREKANGDSLWLEFWLMGVVLLLLMFFMELINLIKASSVAVISCVIWTIFVIKWACIILFTCSVYSIGSRH